MGTNSGKPSLSMAEYQYALPEEAIARYPLPGRERSRLLLYRNGQIDHRRFDEIPELIPQGSRLVFNDTRVIQARLEFRKSTGASIEVFCMEPVRPAEYQQALAARGECTWNCMVGNARKWKSGSVELNVTAGGNRVRVKALREESNGMDHRVRFRWDPPEVPFGKILEEAGKTPIPPYLKRESEPVDRERYQTVYRKLPGSVAAPTAGLHFTPAIMDRLASRGFPVEYLTLHVGAGTFVPVKGDNPRNHAMHAEQVLVSREFIDGWRAWSGSTLAVGTTSLRSLETLYWLGAGIRNGRKPDPRSISFGQWDHDSIRRETSLPESLEALSGFMAMEGLDRLRFHTRLMIIPGYRFRAVRGLITNFHLPGSTLLLLIAALVGDDWKRIYREALQKEYRFLSYGDSSLLLPEWPGAIS